MEVFSAGAWRTAIGGEIYVGGQWRSLKRGEAYKDDSWRATVSFAPPMSVSANNTDGGSAGSFITSAPSTATPTGGTAPYSYAWSILSGAAAINSPTSASTTFSGNAFPGAPSVSTAQVIVTDAHGDTASITITVTLINDGSGGIDP